MNPLNNRVISGFPLSIATSHVFESIFLPQLPVHDPDRKIPTKIDITKYNFFYINISTLFRNIIGSLQKNDFGIATPLAVADVLDSEIKIIESLLSHEGIGKCVPMFYIGNYNSWLCIKKLKKNTNLSFRKDNTEYQKAYLLKLNQTFELLLKNTNSNNVIELNSPIMPNKYPKGLILTHIPYDLLSYKHFNNLDLIESHTGKLKHRGEWYTKFYQIKDISLINIPFIEMMLLIFGDNIMFKPMDLKIRKAILEVSNIRKWTAFTTVDKVKLDLELTKNNDLINLIRI